MVVRLVCCRIDFSHSHGFLRRRLLKWENDIWWRYSLSLSLFVLVHSWGGGHDVFMSIDEHNIRLQRRLGIDFLTLPIPTPSTRRHPLLPTLSLSPDSFVGRYKRSRSIEPTLPVRMSSPPPPPTHKELENHSPLYIRDDLIIKFQARWSQLVSTALLPRCRK